MENQCKFLPFTVQAAPQYNVCFVVHSPWRWGAAGELWQCVCVLLEHPAHWKQYLFVGDLIEIYLPGNTLLSLVTQTHGWIWNTPIHSIRCVYCTNWITMRISRYILGYILGFVVYNYPYIELRTFLARIVDFSMGQRNERCKWWATLQPYFVIRSFRGIPCADIDYLDCNWTVALLLTHFHCRF